MSIKEPVNIMVDLDGVLANFSKRFSEYCREEFGEKYPIIDESMIEDWDWTKWYNNIHPGQVEYIWKKIINTRNFWTTLELLNESEWLYFLNKLNDDTIGHNVTMNPNIAQLNVYFITARERTKGSTVSNQSAYWLSKNGWDNPIVLESRDKEKLIKYLNIKFVIDDKAENLIDIKKEVPNCNIYAYDVQHNKEKLEKSGIKYKRTKLKEFVDDVLYYLQKNA